jgi:hypothetical protein
MAAMLNTTLWIDNGTFPPFANIYPSFSFVRIIYNLTKACSEENCYDTMSKVDSETLSCLANLYFFGLLYMLLGTYFNEIIK